MRVFIPQDLGILVFSEGDVSCLQDDVIARVCPATLEDLRGEILTTDWSHVLKEGEMKTKVVAALASTRDTLHPHLKAAEKAAGARPILNSEPYL
jgi:hypothetical protein